MQGFRTALESHFDTHQLSHMTQEYRDLNYGGGGLSKAIDRGKID